MDNVPCGVSANNVALYQWSTAIKNMGLILQEINFQHSPSTLLWLHLLYFIRLYHYSYSASILDISTNLFKRPCWVVIHQRHDLGYYLLSKFFLLLPIRTWCSHILATPRLSNLPLPPRRSKFWFKPVFLCMFSLCFICSQSCALSICMYNQNPMSMLNSTNRGRVKLIGAWCQILTCAPHDFVTICIFRCFITKWQIFRLKSVKAMTTRITDKQLNRKKNQIEKTCLIVQIT